MLRYVVLDYCAIFKFRLLCLLNVLVNMYLYFHKNLCFCRMAGMELIDPVVDQRHRSNLQDGHLLAALHLHTLDELWLLDKRWVPRFV